MILLWFKECLFFLFFFVEEGIFNLEDGQDQNFVFLFLVLSTSEMYWLVLSCTLV